MILKHQLLYIQSRLKNRSERDISQLEEEISRLIGKADGNGLVAYTNHAPLDIMLNYKIKAAKQQGIEVEVITNITAAMSFNETGEPGANAALYGSAGSGGNVISNENVIHVILCNLLDNAIESFQAKLSSQKRIIVRIYEESQNLYIKISNPYSHELRFQGKKLMTSKKDKSMHSLGLKSVESLVNGQNGYMRLHWEDHVFVAEIVLFHVFMEVGEAGSDVNETGNNESGAGSPPENRMAGNAE